MRFIFSLLVILSLVSCEKDKVKYIQVENEDIERKEIVGLYFGKYFSQEKYDNITRVFEDYKTVSIIKHDSDSNYVIIRDFQANGFRLNTRVDLPAFVSNGIIEFNEEFTDIFHQSSTDKGYYYNLNISGNGIYDRESKSLMISHSFLKYSSDSNSIFIENSGYFELYKSDSYYYPGDYSGDNSNISISDSLYVTIEFNNNEISFVTPKLDLSKTTYDKVMEARDIVVYDIATENEIIVGFRFFLLGNRIECELHTSYLGDWNIDNFQAFRAVL